MSCSNDEACRTCDGRCCSLFTYSTDLKDIADRIADPQAAWDVDDLQILQLLRPITFEEAKERKERYGVEGAFGASIERGETPPNGYYTCRAWDEETRLCTIYEDRPAMCAGYPYGDGRTCDHGCNYTITDEELVEVGYITPQRWFERPYP